MVVFLGVVFLVVAIVYLNYMLRPSKFYRELASERMHPILFYACVTVARIGAGGRQVISARVLCNTDIKTEFFSLVRLEWYL